MTLGYFRQFLINCSTFVEAVFQHLQYDMAMTLIISCLVAHYLSILDGFGTTTVVFFTLLCYKISMCINDSKSNIIRFNNNNSINIISSDIGSPRGNADEIGLIQLNLDAIDVEASLFNAIVVILFTICDTKELETMQIEFLIICLIAWNAALVSQSNTTLQQWFVVAWNRSVGMALSGSELAVIGVLVVVLCKGMEDELIGLFFDVILAGIQRVRGIATVGIEFVSKLVLLVAMVLLLSITPISCNLTFQRKM